MSLSDTIAANNAQAVRRIKDNFQNGNRSDARAILESYGDSPMTVALLTVRVLNRLNMEDRKSFLNWLTAIAE